MLGVTSCTQVSSSRLGSLIRSWMGSSKIGLSQARSSFYLEYNARTRDCRFSRRLSSFSSLSRPCRSSLRASKSCHK